MSGACFGFNPNAEPGHRVALETIRVKGKPLELDRTYVMATKAYVARGRDGYTCLEKCRLLNDPDAGPLLSTVVRNHIQNVSLLKDFEEANNCTVSYFRRYCLLFETFTETCTRFIEEKHPFRCIYKLKISI